MRARWTDKLTLRGKATAAVALVSFLTLAGVAVSGVLQMRRLVRAEEQQTVQAVAQALGNAAELALAVRDEHELSRLAERFMRNDHIVLIVVCDKNDKVIAERSRKPGLWEHYLKGEMDKSIIFSNQPVMLEATGNEFSLATEPDATSEKANAPRSNVGRVVVGLSQVSAFAAVRQQSQLTGLVTFLAATASAVLVYLLVGTWTRRLNHLVVASERMSQGDFEHAIEGARRDEIGRLSQSFEHMRHAVRRRDSDLRHFNNTLQEQVRERTCSLETALREAQAADKAKSRFLATMSHEIRTPLNGVVGTVDLLRQTNLDENQRRYTQIAKSSADALLSVINDILDFSKIEAGRMELDSTVFSLREAVEDATRVAALVGARKGLELGCVIEADVPMQAKSDPGRLRQILANLLNNAIKFTEKGHIVVRANVVERSAGSTLVRFTVSDTGIGIPPDRLDRLFQSFSQVDSSTTRKYGGSGLGLAISKRLAELMGGAIGVESVVGQGSIFWFTVRLADAGDAREKPTPIPRDMRRLRVLVVDDYAVNCEILQQQLALWSLQSATASSGPQALEMLQDAAANGTPFDVAILDWHMPGMDGLSLAHAIRERQDIKEIALIMLTSIEDRISGDELRNLGFSGHLIKPIGQSHLFDAISSAVRKTRNPVEPQTETAASATAAAPPAAFAGLHVLLAEDNEINQMVAAAILAEAGVTCDIVNNGIRAVDAAMTGGYDLVLMDCQMPEMDGFEAAREIRRREAAGGVPREARIPIVALTANAIKGDREQCLQAGMDDYLAKPIDIEKLCAVMRSLVARTAPHRKTRPPSGQAARAGEGTLPQAHAAILPGISNAAAGFPKAPGTAAAPLVPGPAASQEMPPLNVSELCARCANNIEFTQRILNKFQGRVVEDLAALARNITERKLEEATRMAHSLKGSAANLAAPAIRAVAAEIETMSRAGDVSQAQDALQRLQLEVDRCLAYIPQAIASLNVAPPMKIRE